MSFYATLSGKIIFPDKDSFDAFILSIDEYLSKDTFIDETGDEMCDGPHVDRKNLTVVIPFGLYRSINKKIDDVFDIVEGIKGKIIGTSTDGVTCGWTIIADGTEVQTKEFDLIQWAKENDDGDAVPAEDSEDYIDWLAEVEGDFHDTFEN
jgi:hypothetical protein